MSTETTQRERSIERRDVRAREEPLEAVLARPASTGDRAKVNVVNRTHEPPHVYTVTVEADGTVSDCTCPDCQHNLADGETCKHGRFVAAHDALRVAATGDISIADGGEPCDTCAELDPYPCWKCYVSGRRDLPDE